MAAKIVEAFDPKGGSESLSATAIMPGRGLQQYVNVNI
jgi:hypothetical protein